MNGQQLRDLRESIGLLIEDVAEETSPYGLDAETIAAIEDGTAEPTGDQIMMLASFYDSFEPEDADDDY